MALFDETFIRRLENLRLAFARRARGERDGDRTAKRPGASTEFASHRAYSHGDDPSRIDWNAYARLGDLFIKQFERPSTMELKIALDTSASMAPKFDAARRIAAALVFVAEAVYAGVEIGGARGREALALLESLRAEGDAAPALPERPCALIVVSDFWFDEEEFFRRAALFQARGGEAALVHVLSAEEREPTVDGAVELSDAESGARRRLFAGDPEREAYRAALAAYVERLRSEAAKLRAPYAFVPSETPIETVLMEHLRAAGILD